MKTWPDVHSRENMNTGWFRGSRWVVIRHSSCISCSGRLSCIPPLSGGGLSPVAGVTSSGAIHGCLVAVCSRVSPLLRSKAPASCAPSLSVSSGPASMQKLRPPNAYQKHVLPGQALRTQRKTKVVGRQSVRQSSPQHGRVPGTYFFCCRFSLKK